jgi:glycerol uptake facilitator-like aquaporin
VQVLAYSLGHVSGGHFNPAVTFACLIFGQIGPLQAICYMVSQCLGSIVGVFIIKYALALVGRRSQPMPQPMPLSFSIWENRPGKGVF